MLGTTSFSGLLILAVLSILFPTIPGQLLTTEYLNIKLPYKNECPSPWYDGEDSIYLLGGCSSASYTDILKFSITAETLEKVGSLPGDALQGSVQSDNFGNIFYLGGGLYPYYTDVYTFNIATNTTSIVATLPYSVQNSVFIKPTATSNTVLILGGSGQLRDLSSFDMETLTMSSLLTNLPHIFYRGTSVVVGNKAYIFDDARYSNIVNKNALELNLESLNLQPVGPPTLPEISLFPTSVWDGRFAYVTGGYLPNLGAPTDGIIQFDPSTSQNNFIPVRGFPVEGRSYFDFAPASVFVPSNNRIYFFGGQSYNHTIEAWIRHDEIFFIDLTPLEQIILNPDLFSCTGRPNGLYPHPKDFSQFVKCQNEEMTIFSCSLPLLFDPVKLMCTDSVA